MPSFWPEHQEKKPHRAGECKGNSYCSFFLSSDPLLRLAPVVELYCPGGHIDTWNPQRKPVSLARGTGKKGPLCFKECRVKPQLFFSVFASQRHSKGQPQSHESQCITAQGTKTERNFSFWPKELGKKDPLGLESKGEFQRGRRCRREISYFETNTSPAWAEKQHKFKLKMCRAGAKEV